MLTCTHSWDRANVLEAAMHLEGLAQRSGQDDLCARLKFQMSVPYFGAKKPHAFLFYDSVGELRGGVFALEYRFLGWSSAVFIPMDADGDLTVVALPKDRVLVAGRLAEYLFLHGARLVLLSLPGGSTPSTDCLSSALRIHDREVRRTLPLLATVDETLAQMGARSRRNLRHAARQAVKVFNATVIQNVVISEAEVIAFNSICDYPVPDTVAQRLYRNAQTLPECFLTGLRSQGGEWLSLLGGRHHGSISIVDWQMNRTKLGSASIGTAMRFFQIQHEVERGATALRFTGGTPHSMQHAFLAEEIMDCLWIRRPYSSRPFLAAVARLVPSSNGLRELLATSSEGQR